MSRKITFMIFFAVAAAALSLPAAAQHYVGVKGGYGGAKGRFYPAFVTDFVWNKYNAGIMWKYYSPQQVVGGVSVELEYQTRGYRIYDTTPGDSVNYRSKTRIVNSITMPLIWQPHLYLANRRIRVFLNAGFTISYNLGMGDKLTKLEQTLERNTEGIIEVTQKSVTSKYNMNRARDNRWNYGLCGGFGFGYLFGRWEIFAEARYYFGMSDIVRNKTKYQFNDVGWNEDDPGRNDQTIRSELDNVFVTMGVFFRLGQGGIKAPPLRNPNRKKAREIDHNDFRNIKLEF